jgi:hypothetical protein
MTIGPAPVCFECAFFRGTGEQGPTCDAFPFGIPNDVAGAEESGDGVGRGVLGSSWVACLAAHLAAFQQPTTPGSRSRGADIDAPGPIDDGMGSLNSQSVVMFSACL